MAVIEMCNNNNNNNNNKRVSSKTPSNKRGKGHGFTRKCASLVQEQRARIYVLRRCATMLLCWYIQGDD